MVFPLYRRLYLHCELVQQSSSRGVSECPSEDGALLCTRFSPIAVRESVPGAGRRGCPAARRQRG
eukprot:6172804-Lingulodinium_polyedra.AAC.1